MPLISMCGLPNSGKSVRAVEIASYLSKMNPGLEVIIISEDSLHFQRADAYIRCIVFIKYEIFTKPIQFRFKTRKRYKRNS